MPCKSQREARDINEAPGKNYDKPVKESVLSRQPPTLFLSF
ncbi:hypothetical protein CHISP_0053 [Chitinispirillum alkaliphilum]|nr:hypothetical protein CHISP_0053 [Chitinispirillum alkaliphilum]